MTKSEIAIFQLDNGQAEIQVKLDNDTVWLSQKQMSDIFEKDSDTIGLHLKNIYQTGELDEASTTEYSSVVRMEGKRKVTRKIKFYNLDAIISVGYRVNSKRGTQFRIWANRVLKDYLVRGYVLNEQRLLQKAEQLKELQSSFKIIRNILKYKILTNDESSGLLKIIADYSYALDILDRYDYQTLQKLS